MAVQKRCALEPHERATCSGGGVMVRACVRREMWRGGRGLSARPTQQQRTKTGMAKAGGTFWGVHQHHRVQIIDGYAFTAKPRRRRCGGAEKRQLKVGCVASSHTRTQGQIQHRHSAHRLHVFGGPSHTTLHISGEPAVPSTRGCGCRVAGPSTAAGNGHQHQQGCKVARHPYCRGIAGVFPGSHTHASPRNTCAVAPTTQKHKKIQLKRATKHLKMGTTACEGCSRGDNLRLICTLAISSVRLSFCFCLHFCV